MMLNIWRKESGQNMTNFERIKKQIKDATIEDMAQMIIDNGFGSDCNHCIYDDNYACDDDCEYGVKAWLEKEVK